MESLHDILITHFLIDDFVGFKFVGWNANRFDAYFTAAALIRDERFTLHPYLTRSKALRGLRVTLTEDGDAKNARSWEFLDGMAMLGLAGTSLEKLLANFAPEYHKLTGVIDFEREEFDSKNPKHCEYAMRDSVGLWHAMDRAQRIMLDTFNQPLAVTMGGACIKIFQAHIPRDVTIWHSGDDNEKIIREFVLRGGYCHHVRRYHGPIWKYDINQAYAAAMREARLPCGRITKYSGNPATTSQCFIVKITARHRTNKIPFYYRTEVNGRIYSRFSANEIAETWITSIEYRQLQSEGWAITCEQVIDWSASFNMREFVDKLETKRMTCEGGPSGPIGTMIKATGNHAYGKTLEKISPIVFILADECPDDCLPFYADGPDPLEHIFYRFDTAQREKAHHKPQIGAFITAHVRMVLRRVALLAPDSFLYADTDCVVFDSDVTSRMDIDPMRYGAWKIEESGTVYYLIGKKIYAQDGGEKPKVSAKGLNVKRLSADDFVEWFEGREPVQDQIQINNFLAVMDGAEMYRTQRRSGTRVKIEKSSV